MILETEFKVICQVVKCDAFDFPLLILISMIYILVHRLRITRAFLSCRTVIFLDDVRLAIGDAKLPNFTQWDMSSVANRASSE